ncbi:MAG TPA: heat-inducible transcriptional repressor HrcA [Acidimicrobiia bacterium]|nr:heat-inducible transcriptional repressor HrcA [Acidimicrobiia bacterium]
MDERKAAILKALIEEYVETGQPVGSGTVAREAGLNVSSATVRNEMAVLEREGYVTHPHTSAGRVPTDKGYRLFVDRLSQKKQLDTTARQEVASFFATAHHALEDMLHETSLLLSRITAHAAVVVGPQPDSARVRSVQLVRLHETSLLVVAVLSNGQVERQFIEVVDELDEGRIGAATAVLDTQLRDAPFSDLPVLLTTGDPATDQLVAQARDALVTRASGQGNEPVYVGGASRIAADLDAFTAGETVGRLLEVLEHQYLVVTLVRDLIDQGVTVRIGSENRLEDLRECSVVLARFDVEGRPGGSVGVLGPTRMNYPQAMAAVAAVSRRLGEHLSPPG